MSLSLCLLTTDYHKAHYPAPCNIAPAAVANAGSLAACAGTAGGSECPVACSAGFRPVGNYLCSNGAWVGSVICTGKAAR